ncbi:GGDEF domain-containing protein [Butyrivibrio sp. YAB3001]|uniref:GGDEF domain-containing protein n=1 Tax=Butyrivibrio sp. YAB3001 TaxID=1520812 RepID=UPI0008F628D0|nr:GGDEF domain-containing protein [Butyrivibrio sp. YAB3001]SFC84846.1 diguanylate cyclase (GGDEF) domain-containing protein [Butyrivibrio sp. YAB3001]
MNIGLLVSELEDKEVKKICVGAYQAAKDNDITLCIMPGKYLVSDETETNLYDYQYLSVFDYAVDFSFDAIIVDIERIGKNAPILKREAFLNKFSNTPLLTLSEQEGFTSINEVDVEKEGFEQLGYEAVVDAIHYASTKKLPEKSELRNIDFVYTEDNEGMSCLAKLGYKTLHKKYPSEKAYDAFAQELACEDIKNFSVMLYDKKINNTVKYWWARPDSIVIKSNMADGVITDYSDSDRKIWTDHIIKNVTADKPSILIAGSLFVGEYQLGLVITDFTKNMLSDYFFDCLTSLLTGVSRVSYLEKELKKKNEELYEVQEELARDDSVLDHIGDQDYLTGGLNRRGFFAKAYDLLKEKFRPGSYAIVAYIYMDSLKVINEMYGHEEGDRAVRRVSQVLEEVFSDGIYGRIRGNEFAVIQITEEETKAENFRQEMSAQNVKLLDEPSRYMNNLQYSICEFSYDDNLSLREMLKETDENLQRVRRDL